MFGLCSVVVCMCVRVCVMCVRVCVICVCMCICVGMLSVGVKKNVKKVLFL